MCCDVCLVYITLPVLVLLGCCWILGVLCACVLWLVLWVLVEIDLILCLLRVWFSCGFVVAWLFVVLVWLGFGLVLGYVTWYC